MFFVTFKQVSHPCHNCQCCRSVGKQDILLELAANGAFEGNRKDYFLHSTPDLQELINEEIIGESTLTSCFFLKPSSQEFFTSRILVKRKCKLSRFCRADTPLEDLSTHELSLKLKSIGWENQMKAPGSRLNPFTGGRCRKIWYSVGTKPPNRHYLLSLLSSETSLKQGLSGISHFQSDTYYRCILHCLNGDTDKLKLIKPNQPASLYQSLMGNAGNAQKQTSVRDNQIPMLEVDVSIFDQLEYLNRRADDVVAIPDEPSAVDDEDKDASYRRLYIRHQDLVLFGWTDGCAACEHMRRRVSRTGILHSEACRSRIMSELEKTSDGKERLKELKKREDIYVENLQSSSQIAKRPRTA